LTINENIQLRLKIFVNGIVSQPKNDRDISRQQLIIRDKEHWQNRNENCLFIFSFRLSDDIVFYWLTNNSPCYLNDENNKTIYM
jgi:hypothetical protein